MILEVGETKSVCCFKNGTGLGIHVNQSEGKCFSEWNSYRAWTIRETILQKLQKDLKSYCFRVGQRCQTPSAKVSTI
jgi:hypothetical protein